jgi:hypothetical protein
MPLAPCGTCWECENSRSMRYKDLNWPPPAGTPNGAGFRQYATLNKKCVFIRVLLSVAPESVIAFKCALPTANRQLFFTKVRPVLKCLSSRCVIEDRPMKSSSVTLSAERRNTRIQTCCMPNIAIFAAVSGPLII